VLLVKRTGFSRIDTQAKCEKWETGFLIHKTREMPEVLSEKRSFPAELFSHFTVHF